MILLEYSDHGVALVSTERLRNVKMSSHSGLFTVFSLTIEDLAVRCALPIAYLHSLETIRT